MGWKVGYYGALNLKTGCLLAQEAVTFNSETFGDFVRYLLHHTRGKVYLILDNATYHRAQDLKELFTQHRRRLVRIFLPPYSPELNPIERVWRITRRQATHNRYFSSTVDLRTALNRQFSQWQQSNHALRVLCANI